MRIWLVEDSQTLADALRNALVREGHACDHAADGEQALAWLRDHDPDLMVLDWMLPGRDGLSVLKEARAMGWQGAVLMLTARDQVGDRVAALDAGADDYLIKPFALDEMLARLRALARRPVDAIPSILAAGELELDPRSRVARWQGRNLELTPKEFALLELLLRHRGRVFSRTQIFDRLYDGGSHVSDKVVEVIVSTLRTKLAQAGIGDLIRTRRGFGYVFE